MFISSVSPKQDWSSYICIMPSVSIGNVGQLSVDLLLSTLQVKRVGYFHSDAILPLVGNDPFQESYLQLNQCSLVTSAEVYESTNEKLIVVQIRGSIVPKRKKKFREQLIKWIKEEKFGKVILLSSSAAHERLDSQLTGSPLRFLCTPHVEKDVDLEKLFGWQKLEYRKAPPPTLPELYEITSPFQPELYIPGGGITKLLFEDCCKENVPLIVLLLFCSEGDNIPDALSLTSYLNKWLHLIQETKPNKVSWKIPVSWRYMFGNSAPKTMF